MAPSLPLLRTFGYIRCLTFGDQRWGQSFAQRQQTLQVRGRAGHQLVHQRFPSATLRGATAAVTVQ